MILYTVCVYIYNMTHFWILENECCPFLYPWSDFVINSLKTTLDVKATTSKWRQIEMQLWAVLLRTSEHPTVAQKQEKEMMNALRDRELQFSTVCISAHPINLLCLLFGRRASRRQRIRRQRPCSWLESLIRATHCTERCSA